MAGINQDFTRVADACGVVEDEILSALDGGYGGGADRSDEGAEEEGCEFHDIYGFVWRSGIKTCMVCLR